MNSRCDFRAEDETVSQAHHDTESYPLKKISIYK